MATFKNKASFNNVRVIRETPAAILVDIPEFGEEVWIPQGQIDDDSEVYGKGHEGTLVVSQWIAEEKGLV